MPSKLKIHSALLIVGLIYGANYTIAKSLMPDYVDAYAIIVVRVTIGTLLFWLLHYLDGGEKIQYKRDYITLALLSVIGVTINQLLFFKGLSFTNPISASVIMTSSPITVLIVSYLVLKEKITFRKVLGIGLGAYGAIRLIGLEGVSFAHESFKGNLFILINAISFSTYLVLVKPLMLRYKTLTVIKWVFFFSMFVVIPFGWNELTQVDWAALPMSAWLALGYVVIGTTFLAYLLNTWALNYVSPTIVGYYIYLQPLFSTLIAITYRGDTLSRVQVVSAVFIFTGVFLVSFKKTSKTF